LTDITADSKVDLDDAVIALQILANTTPAQKYYLGGNVNGDNKIGLPEAIYIMQKTSGIK
jgi:hypothetical protein